MNDDIRCVLCAILEFDDGTSSVTELHRGDLKTCQKIGDLIPAICNSTGKKAINSYLCTPLESEYDEAIAQGQDIQIKK